MLQIFILSSYLVHEVIDVRNLHTFLLIWNEDRISYRKEKLSINISERDVH